MADDRLVGVQPVGNAGDVELRFRRFEKLSENRFHQHLISLHGVESGKKSHLSGNAEASENKPVFMWRTAYPEHDAGGAQNEDMRSGFHRRRTRRGFRLNAMNWKQSTASFTANSQASTITFFNGDGPDDNSNGLDNIVVLP